MSIRQMVRNWLGALPAGMFAALALSGCHTCDKWLEEDCCDQCSTILPGSLPEPNGTFVRRMQAIQANKAEADDFVFYVNEWRGIDLGPYGTRHLGNVIKRLPSVEFEVLIQMSGNAQLDAERREKIVAALLAADIMDANERVIVGYPDAEGLDANEAERIYIQSLQNWGMYGYGGYGYGGFGGGFGGFGGGFGRFGGFGGLGRGVGMWGN